MERLRLLRKTQMMSQSTLAEKLHLSQQSIYKYEHGLAEPDISTLIKIAYIYHTSVDYLIGHDNGYEAVDHVNSNGRQVKLNNAEKLIIEIYRDSPADVKKSILILVEHIKVIKVPKKDKSHDE